MLTGIDHLVIAVRDPDAAAAVMTRDLGLAAAGGGRHEAWGTFNRLAFLGEAYVELIGVFDRALAGAEGSSAVVRATLAVLDDGHEGLATFAVATDDIAADVARLRAAGSGIGEPAEGTRVRPDGAVVRWSLATTATLGPDEPPFLIEHDDAAAEWDARARAGRAAFRHPAGGRVRLTGVELPVAEPDDSAASYASTVGIRLDASSVARIGSQELRLRRRDGDPPIVDLAAEPGTPPLDVTRLGVRWRRRG